MSERVDWLLPSVATELDLQIVAPLSGGEFGAALVRDRDGQELVLKALGDPLWAPRFRRGAELSALVRSADYPVPRYVGTGVVSAASWSLQERLPGEVPDAMTQVHARQLLGFLQHHQGAADHPGDPVRRLRQEVGGAATRLAAYPATAAIADELKRAMARPPDIELRRNDVVHGDFHHRNYLAIGESVTGVFDWELAWAGDWRVDLVNLACWGSWVPAQIPPPALAPIVDEALTACPPPLLSLFAAFHTLRAVDFNVRVHPDRLPTLLESIDATTRPWLRLG